MWHVECGDGIEFPFSRGCSFITLSDGGRKIQTVSSLKVQQMVGVLLVCMQCVRATYCAWVARLEGCGSVCITCCRIPLLPCLTLTLCDYVVCCVCVVLPQTTVTAGP